MIQKKSIYALLCSVFSIFVFQCFIDAQPNSVTNLSALAGDYSYEIKLKWTYPGPGILPSGSAYYIQRSTWAGVSWSTSSAQTIISTGPVNVLENQMCSITGLSGGATYYFHLWTSSGVAGLVSEISNRATYYLAANAEIALTKNYSVVQKRPGDIITYTIKYENVGNSNATNIAIRDKIPSYCDYIAGSIKVDGVGKTDAQDSESGPDADYTDGIISVIFDEINLLPATTGYI
ncbi:MAG: DUF11 domain-containing protein, partial [Elusimicrobiota bacterium]|nr:DUF11 domain-containing protein [Elusimicrobiota bacterium]